MPKFTTVLLPLACALGLAACDYRNPGFENVEFVERVSANYVMVAGTPTLEEVREGSAPGTRGETVRDPRRYYLVEREVFESRGEASLFGTPPSCLVSDGLANCRERFEREAQRRQSAMAREDDGDY